jgi:hypothetical protein
LAVNAFTLVLVVDPTSAEGLILIDMLYQMWREYYPIRIGRVRLWNGVCNKLGQRVPSSSARVQVFMALCVYKKC